MWCGNGIDEALGRDKDKARKEYFEYAHRPQRGAHHIPCGAVGEVPGCSGDRQEQGESLGQALSRFLWERQDGRVNH